MKALGSDRVRLVAAVAGVNILLAAGGWLLLVSPQRQHAQQAAQQAQQTQSQVADLAKSLAHPQAAPQPRIRTADLYKLAQAMPAGQDEPDLLLTLTQTARAAGVQVLGVSPGTPTAAVGYTVVPVTLNIAGAYPHLTTFLSRLRELVSVRHGALFASGRLFAVTSVSLTPSATGSQLTGTVGVDAFVFGAVAGATPLPTTTTPSSTTGTTTGATTTTGQ
jgi:Tfp pilus assembly protein PilO